MGNILRMEKQHQIQALVRLGWSDRSIRAQTGFDRDTIAKYRRIDIQNRPKVPTDSGTVSGTDPTPPPQNPPEVPADLPLVPGTNSRSILLYREKIRNFFFQQLTAQRIYQDLVEDHGYRGSYDSVKRYVRKLRKRTRGFTERLAHHPGREAQVDFGKATCRVTIDGRSRRPWLFKMTLSCSKHAYEELVERQDLETFLRCHERAFRFFGGVPEIVTLDNIKSGVLQACLYDPIMNQSYQAFAAHWGFAANPCMPYTPEHKGVVERDIGYTKHNALDGRTFEDLENGNVFLRQWNRRWARTRIHGTTKCQVWKLFCELEHARLRPVALQDFEHFNVATRKVDVTGMIEVEARYYPVPPKHIGDRVVVHYNRQTVRILDGATLIIAHRRHPNKGGVTHSLACMPPWKHPDLESQERFYCRKAREVGPVMFQIVHAALSSDNPLAIRRVRGLLSLQKKFGAAVAEQAAQQARTIGRSDYHIVKALCLNLQANGTDTPKPALLTQNHELIRPLDAYNATINERSLS